MRRFKNFIIEEKEKVGYTDKELTFLNRVREYHWRLGRHYELEGDKERFRHHNEIGQTLDSVLSYHKGSKRMPETMLPHIDTVP